MRKALALLLVLVMALLPVVAGCTDASPGPEPADNSTVQPGPTDNGTADNGTAEPGPDQPGPVDPGPAEPEEPAGPEFPRGLFGSVFDDANANGVRDEGEPGVAGVLVSNGIACRATDADGVYNLPSDNSLVFMTVPGDRACTGPWYSAPGTDNIDFGLRPAPEKAGAEAGFTFIQVTDLHAYQTQAAPLADLAAELNSLSPAFVVATGDLILDGNTANVATANAWFDVYENFTSQLAMPVYQAVGNHDVVGIYPQAPAEAGQGYGKEIFLGRFGPAYYSFDWGRYHCIVLDPNDMEGGKQVYRIPPAQVGWLADDLSCRGEAPLLVFFHEPSVSWANRRAVLDLFAGRDATLFCGHLHQGATLESGAGGQSIPEHITAAVCGEWWRGPNPDGRPRGYRLVSVQGDGVDSLYMGTGDPRTVDFGITPVVAGDVPLAVKLYSRYGPITAATCLVDDNQTLALALEDAGLWSVASASWGAAALSEGYHRLTLTATDSAGTFEREFLFKRADCGTVSLADLVSHRDAFRGHYISIEAPVFLLLAGPLSVGIADIPAGMGFLVLKDGDDMLVVVAGEVFSPRLPGLLMPRCRVIIKAVPVRLALDTLMSTAEWDAYYPLIESYLGMLPPSTIEPPDAASMASVLAVWGARWLSADDLALAPAPAPPV